MIKRRIKWGTIKRRIKIFRKGFLQILMVVLALGGSPGAAWGEAEDYSQGLGRIRSCSAQGEPDGLHFDPTTAGQDAEFVMANPVCAAVASYAYGAVKISIWNMNKACGNTQRKLRVKPTPVLDAIDVAKASAKSVTGNLACAKSMAKGAAAFSVAIAYLGGVYGVAKDVYSKAKICGSDWKMPNPKQFLINKDEYKGTVETKIKEYINNPLLRHKLNLNDKYYREWYYGGVEIEDDSCLDVTKQSINGTYPKQKYYLKGYETGNFNCEKYDILPGQKDPRGDSAPVNGQRLKEFRDAYNCCVNKSQNYICIDFNGYQKFCRAGEKCNIESGKRSDLDAGTSGNASFDFNALNDVNKMTEIVFETRYKANRSMICAQTYSLCPYNFYIGGGSEVCDYYQDGIFNHDSGQYDYITLDDVKKGNCMSKSEIRNADCTYNNKAGKCRNYCQYMRHCTKTNSVYKYRTSLSAPYFSEACLNFVGDSQNKVSYDVGFVLGGARHLSAPVAQCFKETMENMFYNRAGHTKCLIESEIPNHVGECPSGEAFKKGEQVESHSFFTRMQSYLNFSIKLVLTLAIVFFGTKIMIGNQEVKRAELMKYIVKFALVMFFALGDAWQGFFFEGVFNAPTVFSKMVFKIQMPTQENKRDGCQFGLVTDYDGNEMPSAITYPEGKEYIAIWDTLDCKIARYMGFGPELSASNLARLVIASYITGSIGLKFAVALMFFGFLAIAMTIKALHIFIGSSVAIILLIFISPITITGLMFKKTEGLFQGWLKQLIGFSLQPMVLFAYIAIFLSILDKTLTGSATFYGQPPIKTVSCDEYCVNLQGDVVSETESPECDRDGEKMLKPESDSVECMISYDAFGGWPGLEVIGITLPLIIGLIAEDGEKKLLTIIKAVIIIYFLDKFLVQIPEIAVQLVGGGKLPMNKVTAGKIFGSVAGGVGNVQKRLARGAKKGLKKIGEGAKKEGKSAMNDLGNKGKGGVGVGGPVPTNAKDAVARTAGGAQNAVKKGASKVKDEAKKAKKKTDDDVKKK